ncbi:hypothetical protein JCM10213_008719 [Rhodosporidiobolus nylandii]
MMELDSLPDAPSHPPATVLFAAAVEIQTRFKELGRLGLKWAFDGSLAALNQLHTLYPNHAHAPESARVLFDQPVIEVICSHDVHSDEIRAIFDDSAGSSPDREQHNYWLAPRPPSSPHDYALDYRIMVHVKQFLQPPLQSHQQPLESPVDEFPTVSHLPFHLPFAGTSSGHILALPCVRVTDILMSLVLLSFSGPLPAAGLVALCLTQEMLDREDPLKAARLGLTANLYQFRINQDGGYVAGYIDDCLDVWERYKYGEGGLEEMVKDIWIVNRRLHIQDVKSAVHWLDRYMTASRQS